jgi:hypothetical protein
MMTSSIAIKKPLKKASIDRATYNKEQYLKKQYLDISLGTYVLRYCDIRTLQLINTGCGTVYSLYRASVYLSYSYSYINLCFTEREVIWCGRTVRVRRMLMPRLVDANRLRTVAFRRVQECLSYNKIDGFSYYFLTLRKGEDIKTYLSSFFYKNSSYKYICFNETGSKSGGVHKHNHFILILPECIKNYINPADRKFSYIKEENLNRAINYCTKSISKKSISYSRKVDVPRLIRINKAKLDSMLQGIFSKSQPEYTIKTYTRFDGEECIRLSIKMKEGLERTQYKLNVKKKLNKCYTFNSGVEI